MNMLHHPSHPPPCNLLRSRKQQAGDTALHWVTEFLTNLQWYLGTWMPLISNNLEFKHFFWKMFLSRFQNVFLEFIETPHIRMAFVCSVDFLLLWKHPSNNSFICIFALIFGVFGLISLLCIDHGIQEECWGNGE